MQPEPSSPLRERDAGLLAEEPAQRTGTGPDRTAEIRALVAVPCLIALRLSTGEVAPLIGAVVAGVALNIPFAVLVKLGQDYLPSRSGTAAGVTLGLAVGIGGLIRRCWA